MNIYMRIGSVEVSRFVRDVARCFCRHVNENKSHLYVIKKFLVFQLTR